MNLKLLVAACCLLAAVQARPPRPLSSSCSASCVSRTFWSGYRAGNVYTYDFDQSVELSSELNPSQASRLKINGQAKVEVLSDCEMALTVEVKNAKVGDLDDASSLSPRDPPAKVLAGLRAPLRFAFDNGRVVELCPGAEETRASLNLKRGLLSQLQVSTEQRGQAHEFEERDILGDCWTEYTPEGPNTLVKTKDLAKCKKLNYQSYPLLGVKSFEDETTQSKRPITKGSLTCRMEIDPERDIVKSTSCQEEQRQSARHQSDSIEEKIRTTTRLTLKNEESGLISALHEVSKRTDLRHGHKSSSQCQNASAWLEEDIFHSATECVERKHGAETSSQYFAKANETLNQLCEATKNQSMSRDVPKKYADLIKYMRGITDKAQLAQLYKQVRAAGYCDRNPLMLVILRSAIPTVGTKQSVQFIIDELQKSEDSAAGRNDWIVNGVALMQHPTPEILPGLLSYVRSLRDQDQALITGVNRDEPLALSAVVHKICQELPNCESDSRVKAVIDYFADSLGPACAKFNGADSDNAFVALLAIGNMGRMRGGVNSLVQCANNQRLQIVYRAFALHSLRRFSNFSTTDKHQLSNLLLDESQDAEVRIAAFQALARHGFSNPSMLRDYIRQLLDRTEADRQVQMFVYTHLKNLKGQDARIMSPILLSAKTATELKKLSRRQYSNVLKGQYYSPALEAGAQAEVPIVFSAQSAIPRYIGLNLTVNMPSQGQSINLMEIGLRMQGLEKLIEQTYSLIAKKYSQSEPSSDEAPATAQQPDDLTDEQRRLTQTRIEPRIDLFVRRYGVELSHTDLSGGIIESLPALIASGQAGSLMPSMVSGKPGAAAGTLMESTLSIPTTAGLPILVKQESHYVTNLRSEMSFSQSTGLEATVQVQPTAAIQMLRTVAVDAIFERAGIQSSTSFLSSTGVRVNLKKNLDDSSDRQLLVKIEPLNKRQSVAEVKTEVKFFQHTAGKQHVEKALTPQQASVQSERCVEGLAKKLGGHKICFKTESLPNCQTSPCKILQCPSSYQLFLEKSDDFSAFEVNYKWKSQRSEKQLQLLIGDRKSKERLLKFNIQSVSRRDNISYKLELQNPIFPIVIDSNFTKSESGHQVNAKAQIGSVEYLATGSVRPDSEKGVIIQGEVHPKDKIDQKVQVTLEHKFSGLTPVLLPIATTKLQAKMHTKNELNLEYDLKLQESNFFWQMGSEYKTQKGDTTAVRYRVQYRQTVEGSADDASTVFLYDFALQNPMGKNFMHNLHSKLTSRSEADGKQYSATISHKLQYGSDSAKSPFDFDARFGVKKIEQSQKTEISGSGEVTYSKEGRSVTAKVDRVKIEMSQFTNATDGLGKQYKYALSYGISFEGQTAQYQAELQHLPWGRWSLGKQAVQMKAKAQLGSKSYAIQVKHVLNTEKMLSEQIAKAEYNDYVYFHLQSKLQKAEGVDAIRHEFFWQDWQDNKMEIKSGLTRPEEGVVNADVIVKKNDAKVLSSIHSLRLKQVGPERDHELKHKMTLETREKTYDVENRVSIDQQSLADIAELMAYQVRLVAGRYRIEKSLQLLNDLLWGMRFEHESKMTGPAATQEIVLQNVIKLESREGEIWKHLLRVKGWSDSEVKYGVSAARTKDSASGKGIKVEVYCKDQSIKSNASYDGESGSLKIASMDSWRWHDVKMDMKIRYLDYSTRSPKYEALANLEGQISAVPLSSKLNVTGGRADSENYLVAALTIRETKLRLELNAAPTRKAAELKLEGDFGVLPLKSMKAKSEISQDNGAQFESEIEIDNTKIVGAMLKIESNIFMVDLKTAHPLLQEAGIKIRLETDVPEAIKFDAIAKIVSLTKQMQIKKSGTATFSRSTPGYSFLLGLTGKAEIEGFEGQISYKKLEYELMLKKKPTMEFEFVASVSSPDHTTTKEPMLLLASAINYWPFKAEAKVKAKNYGSWEVKYGARMELDSKNAFAGVEYNDEEAAATYEVEDLSCGTRKVNFRVKCSFCTNEVARDLIVGQANMTYPLQPTRFQLGLDMDLASSKLQMVAFRFEHSQYKKQILAAFRWNGSTHKLINCAYTQTDAADGIKGEVLLHSDLRFFLGDMARVKLQASYNYGSDKTLNASLSMADRDEELLKAKLFWLNSPRSDSSIPVANIDRGMQIKGSGIDAYFVRAVKPENNFEWKSSVQLPQVREPITASWEYEDAKIKSGKVSAFGREFAVTSGSDGEIQVTMTTDSDEANTLQVKWEGKYQNWQDARAKIEIESDGETKVIEVKMQQKQIAINYGKSSRPNLLRVDYELTDASADLTINHETNAENTELTLWPNYKIQLPTTSYPMKLTIGARVSVRKLSIVFEAPCIGVKSMNYEHDFRNAPQAFKIESDLVSTSDEKIWVMKVDVDMDMPSVEATCKIGNQFSASFREPKFELKLKDKIDLKVQFPKFLSGDDDSDKKELIVQLALPGTGIDQPVSLKAEVQQLTEGRQMKVQYGLGEDTEQIVWVLTARKYRFKPRLNLDLETSLTSKFDLLSSWQIRSLEARLESKMESDSDAYTLVYKDTIKINGEDLSTTDARLDGQSGYGVKKVEVQITGKMEWNMKFESASEDRPAKLSFSLDKFGDNLQKYSLKLSYNPAKENAVLPDFKLETECPRRQFVIGKEFRETASESLVTMELYLDKRQSHGVTVLYKSKSPASEARTYTLEIILPTRKIRMDVQPEVTDNKLKIKNTIAWDADVSTEKAIELTIHLAAKALDSEFELECKAPFLRNPIKLEARLEHNDGGYTVQLKHKNGEIDVLAAKYAYSRDSQGDHRINMEVSGSEDSKIILSVRSQVNYNKNWNTQSKIDGTLKLKLGSMDKNIKFVLQPWRELTVSCKDGVSLSLKSDGKNFFKLVAFASSKDESASRLKFMISAPTKKITLKLDQGRGSFHHDSDLRLPKYTPEKVLLRSKISVNSKELIATVFIGEMTVGQKPDLFDAASVPARLGFYGLAYRQMDDSKMSFRVNWRHPSQENSAVRSMQRSLSSSWTDAISAVSEFSGLNPLLGGTSSNVDADWIAEEIRNLASNDIDKLSRYVKRAMRNNDLYIRSALEACQSATQYAQGWLSVASEVLSGWMEALDQSKIPQWIAQCVQQALDFAANLCNKISIQDFIDRLVAVLDQVKDIIKSCSDKAIEIIDILKSWLSDLTDIQGTWSSEQAEEYLNSMAPWANAIKNAVAKIWAPMRTMLAATVAGAKPLAVDDLLPLGMNHIADIQIIRNLCNNLMLELRVWYDTGATPVEREALSETSELLSYVFSEESLSKWRYLAETIQLILNGDIRQGMLRLKDEIRYTVWRPECIDACLRSETPYAAVEGEIIYSKLPRWSSYSAPQIVLRRVLNKLTRRGLPKASDKMAALIKLALGDWNPAFRLLAIRHRTAILSGDNHLITFDGVALSHKRPCSYLIARDFECSAFSIVQEYRRDSAQPERQVRGSLRIRFGMFSLSIERNGTVKLNDKTESLPLEKKSSDDKSVDARREGDLVTVRFHGKLPNTLVVRCSRAADSCLISVHPLYQGRVLGLAGSNDGRRVNDIREGRASRHMNFWTAGQCKVEAVSDSAAEITEEQTGDRDSSGDCYNWFGSRQSPMLDCFETVDPRPYWTICRRQERQDSDACAATRQYAARCKAEGISVRVPSKCVACQVDSEGPIVKGGKVSDKASLKERMQVVFLVEDNACGAEAAVPAERIKELAQKIDQLKSTDGNLKSVKFGIAKYSDALYALPVSDEHLFGSYSELEAALDNLRLSRTSSASPINALQAVADLPEQYEWERLAQKHLFVLTCTPCTGLAWSYNSVFAKAQRSVKDQIFVHTISKTAIKDAAEDDDVIGYGEAKYYKTGDRAVQMTDRADRQFEPECTTELALDADNKAKGSVWRLDKFYESGSSGDNQLAKSLVTNEIASHLRQPRCRQCSCNSATTAAKCKIVECEAN
uniref:VWFD domain-containing protein n=1 Tax=Macrostomum lignano TaxID=282301 RepID=A0A1I8GGF5_9PLAT